MLIVLAVNYGLAHINTICAKVAPRLYYLKRLRRTGLPSGDLLYFYLTVIRPVLEYGCAVWHHGLTVAQSPKLESLQKRALKIIRQMYKVGQKNCTRLSLL